DHLQRPVPRRAATIEPGTERGEHLHHVPHQIVLNLPVIEAPPACDPSGTVPVLVWRCWSAHRARPVRWAWSCAPRPLALRALGAFFPAPLTASVAGVPWLTSARIRVATTSALMPFASSSRAVPSRRSALS